MGKEIIDLLKKPDSQGYYVLFLDKVVEDNVKNIYGDNVIIDYFDPNTIVVRVKSRRIAKEIAKKFYRYIATP